MMFDDSMTGKCGKAIQALSRFIDTTNDPKKILSDWSSIIQFDLIGEEPFYLTISGGSASFNEGKVEAPDAVLSGKSNTFFDVITGKLDPDVAYAMKKYDVKGSVVDAMKFRRVSELTEERHKATFSILKKVGGIAFR